MNIGIVGDVHWCTYSSILRQRDGRYSLKLRNLIASVNFSEKETENCDLVVYLGDFFDRADITAEEMSAFREVCWNNKPHCFLVGNHESESAELVNSTARVFNLLNFSVYTIVGERDFDDIRVLFIPYQTDRERLDLNTIPKSDKKTIIFSHNDIQMQYGAYCSTVGFTVEDIEKNCDLFINGHLHNFNTVGDRIINVGNLTGQNFCEDGFVYRHKIAFLDTDTMKVTYKENPYAINFYKLDLTNGVAPMHSLFNSESGSSAVSAICLEDNADEVKEYLDKHAVASRVVLMKKEAREVPDSSQEIRVADHLELFKKYISEKYPVDSEIEKREMSLVVR